MKPGYENLNVYRRFFSIALEIYKFSRTLPDIEKYALADQMRRSSTSICANIAEGHGKSHFSKAEFRRFLIMACGSSEEMKVWISFAKELGYLEEKISERWYQEYCEITMMLNGLIQKL
jgi:four helix bundle protein